MSRWKCLKMINLNDFFLSGLPEINGDVGEQVVPPPSPAEPPPPPPHIQPAAPSPTEAAATAVHATSAAPNLPPQAKPSPATPVPHR